MLEGSWERSGLANSARVYREFNGNSTGIVRLGGHTRPGLKIIPEFGVGFPFSHCAVTAKLLKTEHEECINRQKQRESGVWKRPRHSQAVTMHKVKGKAQIYRSVQGKPKRTNKARSVTVPENSSGHGPEGGKNQGFNFQPFSI